MSYWDFSESEQFERLQSILGDECIRRLEEFSKDYALANMSFWEFLENEPIENWESLLSGKGIGRLGEFSTEYLLTNSNLYGERIILKNLYVPNNGKTAEVDLLMIHEKGIFVFESKNYGGWIFGDKEQLNWTQCLKNGDRQRFYNPVRQNKTHILALSRYLKIPPSAFTSCIIFSERCSLKKVPKSCDDFFIVRRPNMLDELRLRLKNSPIVYSASEMQSIADRLMPLTNKSDAEKQRYINDIQTKCRFCGSKLVLRNGKYGPFWGCSAYPNCRFTKSI